MVEWSSAFRHLRAKPFAPTVAAALRVAREIICARSDYLRPVSFYDALDNRIGMDENSTQTWTLYDRGNPIMDFNGSGSLTMRYLWGPTGIVARQTSGGTVSWYLADHLGTVRDLINNSGAIIDHVDFSAFGTVLDESSPTNGDRMIGFAALERDTVTGLNLAVEREENPGTGRWDSQDPLGFGGGEDNLYGYVANSPTDCEDTSGLDARALPAAPTMDPAAFLGPGDLVILTGNFAQGNENQGAFVPQLAEFVLASKGRPAKGSPAPGGGFVVSPTQPTTPEELADAINQAVKDNGGRPFRRIIVISHAGGEINAPALNPSKKPGQPDRLFFCEKEESPAARRTA